MLNEAAKSIEHNENGHESSGFMNAVIVLTY
jgi:hypothetical protein